MTELFRNAWMGWQQFIETGKLAALLAAALLYLGISGKGKGGTKQRILFQYGTAAALCCIFPVTAVILMVYQTRFYDYYWTWSLVPMTAVTAWAGTEFLNDSWQGFRLKSYRKGLPVTILLLGALALCSGMGRMPFQPEEERENRRQARRALADIEQRTDAFPGEVLFWAPKEVQGYAREAYGDLHVVYGRNMWDASLGAYCYDIYAPEIQELYLWMENTDETGTADVDDEEHGKLVLRGEKIMASAAEAGVNCIVLPDRLEPETVKTLAGCIGAETDRLDGYWLLLRGE